MEITAQFSQYMSLLRIRYAAKRRDVIITAALFLVSMAAMLAYGLLTGLSGREVYLVGFINVCLGMSFLMTWVKLEIIKGSMDWMENFSLVAGNNPTDRV